MLQLREHFAFDTSSAHLHIVFVQVKFKLRRNYHNRPEFYRYICNFIGMKFEGQDNKNDFDVRYSRSDVLISSDLFLPQSSDRPTFRMSFDNQFMGTREEKPGEEEKKRKKRTRSRIDEGRFLTFIYDDVSGRCKKNKCKGTLSGFKTLRSVAVMANISCMRRNPCYLIKVTVTPMGFKCLYRFDIGLGYILEGVKPRIKSSQDFCPKFRFIIRNNISYFW